MHAFLLSIKSIQAIKMLLSSKVCDVQTIHYVVSNKCNYTISLVGFLFKFGYLWIHVIYRIQSSTVYIKTHFIGGFNSHMLTPMYHVYRCVRSCGTNHFMDLKDHGDEDNRCFNVSLSLITGVRTEYKTTNLGGTGIFTT